MNSCDTLNTPRNKLNLHSYKKREDAFHQERVMGTWLGSHIMRGRKPDKDSLLLMSNDYLSLANDPRILKAQADTLLDTGNGLIMSSVFLHGETPQGRLEKKFAKFLNTERVILCQSGWAANVGLLQTIADKTTPVYLDMYAHMSLWQGVKVSGARAHSFLHNNAHHLERKIKTYGPGIVVVDSIYSSNGSVCPLEEIILLANQYDCVIVVDESHSLGTHGTIGEGLVSYLGLDDKVHFKTASLAKAFAGRAGIITCHNLFYDYFGMSSYPAIFSSSLLEHEIIALDKTLDIISEEDNRREKLQQNSSQLKNGLQQCGYDVSISNSHIISLLAGPEQRTIKLRDALESRGIFGSVFCAPATATNKSLIRFSLNSSLTDQDINRVITVCDEIKDKVDLHLWP